MAHSTPGIANREQAEEDKRDGAGLLTSRPLVWLT
jgi:hypothetical protein